jgi:hypothetical protein
MVPNSFEGRESSISLWIVRRSILVEEDFDVDLGETIGRIFATLLLAQLTVG